MKKKLFFLFLHFEQGPGVQLSNFDWGRGDPTFKP